MADSYKASGFSLWPSAGTHQEPFNISMPWRYRPTERKRYRNRCGARGEEVSLSKITILLYFLKCHHSRNNCLVHGKCQDRSYSQDAGVRLGSCIIINQWHAGHPRTSDRNNQPVAGHPRTNNQPVAGHPRTSDRNNQPVAGHPRTSDRNNQPVAGHPRTSDRNNQPVAGHPRTNNQPVAGHPRTSDRNNQPVAGHPRTSDRNNQPVAGHPRTSDRNNQPVAGHPRTNN